MRRQDWIEKRKLIASFRDTALDRDWSTFFHRLTSVSALHTTTVFSYMVALFFFLSKAIAVSKRGGLFDLLPFQNQIDRIKKTVPAALLYPILCRRKWAVNTMSAGIVISLLVRFDPGLLRCQRGTQSCKSPGKVQKFTFRASNNVREPWRLAFFTLRGFMPNGSTHIRSRQQKIPPGADAQRQCHFLCSTNTNAATLEYICAVQHASFCVLASGQSSLQAVLSLSSWTSTVDPSLMICLKMMHSFSLQHYLYLNRLWKELKEPMERHMNPFGFVSVQ